MAPSNADLIRPIYEEWGRGNWKPNFDVYHPRMHWGWSDEFPGLGGVYEDRDDPNPRLRAWLSEWELWRAEADEIIEHGDQVLGARQLLRHRQGQRRGDPQLGAHLFDLEDGRVVRLEIFATRERARSSRSETGRPPDLEALAAADGRAPASALAAAGSATALVSKRRPATSM